VRAILLLSLVGATARAGEPRIALSFDEGEPPSKKEEFLKEKVERAEVRAEARPRAEATSALTLRNVWTHESYPVAVPPRPADVPFDRLTRCHFTNQSAPMDHRLLDGILKAAAHFRAKTIEVVSGFRAPKYQLMLRKKGHEVARDSEHPRGNAVDFRLPEVPTRALYKFVRSLKLGGVGIYPDSRFVHADVGRIRFWRGH
jgi:uncharacterized protein YcbK (DUF882 family)